jgi:uncharacterized protein with HEPN domain
MSPESRDWRLYAEDIVEACSRIKRYTAGLDYEAFARDEKTRDAVVRNIEIIGEAAKALPDDIIARAPEIPWRKVRGMRDIVAHAYFGLDLKVVWSVCATQIDLLEKAVRSLLA